LSRGRSDPRFDFNGYPLGPYHQYWARQIGALIRQYNVFFLLLHIPEDTETGNTRVPERMFWPEAVGLPSTPILAIPSATLFGNVNEDRVKNYYYDEHFNDNGKELFTRAVTPTILNLYAREVQAKR
jgi:hypothetical protein